MRRSTHFFILAGLGYLLCSHPSGAEEVPSPESHLGYRAGADFHLAEWRTVTDYFHRVDRASARVEVEELGTTTEDRPYLVAIISAPETLAKSGRYRRAQQRLADPRIDARADDLADPVRDSKAVVLITCSIHSSETASTFMAMEFLHELASKDDPVTREILANTIVLLVPSANPDGVDKVARWYERSKGHPWEGSGMPELYHRYAGHDTNRDWFMLNLKETRLLSRLLYKEWFPTVLYDVHQMSMRGPRLFVPPFYDPINPNIDPRIHQSIMTIGAHMAADLAAAGKQGIVHDAIYDNWWNGGNRTTPQRHNIVGVLTEAASVKMATPVFLEKSDLRGGMRGFADHRPTVNFVSPWPGGWWRLRDIVDEELICARSLLTLVARYKTRFQSDLVAMARDAIEKGRREPPFAWVVPSNQRDPGAAATMVGILRDTGIEVRRAKTGFTADGVSFPAGSWILPAAQPFRAHLKDMMERQVYPARFTAGGAAEPPYDVAGWTLPLQMGVKSVALANPCSAETELIGRVEPARGPVESAEVGRFFSIQNQANDDFLLLNELLVAGVEVQALLVHPEHPDADLGTLRLPADATARKVVEKVLPNVSSRIFRTDDEVVAPLNDRVKIDRLRIGLYQPWVPSMDEGWTRLILERFHFPYTILHNAEVRAGELRSRFDTLLIPSIEPPVLRSGYAADETEPMYVGGLGEEGARALRDFVREGGTLVCVERACDYAIDEFRLPVKNVLKNLKSSDFYGPGSVVQLRLVDLRRWMDPDGLNDDRVFALGVPEEVAAYFDRSLAFELDSQKGGRAVLVYDDRPLLSGWLLGADRLKGKAALAVVDQGKGRVVLFGFPPLHRGQTHGTFRLLFNALLRGSGKHPPSEGRG